jgi:hypothetical protein
MNHYYSVFFFGNFCFVDEIMCARQICSLTFCLFMIFCLLYELLVILLAMFSQISQIINIVATKSTYPFCLVIT